MWSMWNAPSDLDYYGQGGFGDDEPEEEEWRNLQRNAGNSGSRTADRTGNSR